MDVLIYTNDIWNNIKYSRTLETRIDLRLNSQNHLIIFDDRLACKIEIIGRGT